MQTAVKQAQQSTNKKKLNSDSQLELEGIGAGKKQICSLQS